MKKLRKYACKHEPLKSQQLSVSPVYTCLVCLQFTNASCTGNALVGYANRTVVIPGGSVDLAALIARELKINAAMDELGRN